MSFQGTSRGQEVLQREGIDFDQTFAPVVRHESIRTVLSTAAANDLEIIQLDVRTAFLNGDLNEEIFMEQPAGFVLKEIPHHV